MPAATVLIATGTSGQKRLTRTGCGDKAVSPGGGGHNRGPPTHPPSLQGRFPPERPPAVPPAQGGPEHPWGRPAVCVSPPLPPAQGGSRASLGPPPSVLSPPRPWCPPTHVHRGVHAGDVEHGAAALRQHGPGAVLDQLRAAGALSTGTRSPPPHGAVTSPPAPPQSFQGTPGTPPPAQRGAHPVLLEVAGVGAGASVRGAARLHDGEVEVPQGAELDILRGQGVAAPPGTPPRALLRASGLGGAALSPMPHPYTAITGRAVSPSRPLDIPPPVSPQFPRGVPLMSPRVSPKCPPGAPSMPPPCPLHVPRVSPQCPLHIPRASPQSLQGFPLMSPLRVSPAPSPQRPHNVPPPGAPSMSPRCPREVPSMATTCPQDIPWCPLHAPKGVPRMSPHHPP